MYKVLEKYYRVNKNLLLICLLEYDIKVVRILESYVGNDREYEFIYS